MDVKYELLQNDEKESILYGVRKTLLRGYDYNFGCNISYSLKWLREKPSYQKNVIFNQDHLKYLVERFRKWVEIRTYLTYGVKVKSTGENKLGFALASKRGNQVYENNLHKKLNEQLNFMSDPNFYKLVLRDKKGSRGKVSNVAFMTLTCDPKKYNNSIVEAWLNFDKEYNIFVTRIRKKFGKSWVMKSLEATAKGYPHFHLLVITEKEFDVFYHKNKEGFNEIRMCDKRQLEAYWSSKIDVVIPNPIKAEKELKKGGCVSFMKDYIFKDMLKSYHHKNRDFKGDLSLAMGWLLGKRSYSVSKKSYFHALITCISVIQTIQEELFTKNPDFEYTFLGLTDFKFFNRSVPPPWFSISENDKRYEDCFNSIYGSSEDKLQAEYCF